jgi:hypothetical protein
MRVNQNSDSLGDPNNAAPVFQARTILTSQTAGPLKRLCTYISESLDDLNDALGEIKQYYIGSVAGALGFPSGLTSITAVGDNAPALKWIDVNTNSSFVPIGLTNDGNEVIVLPSGVINYQNHWRTGQVYNTAIVTYASGLIDSQLECDLFTQPDYASGNIDAMIAEPLYSPSVDVNENYSLIASNATLLDITRDTQEALGNNEFISRNGRLEGEQTFQEGRLSHTDNINRIQNKYFYVNWCIDLDMIDASNNGGYLTWGWDDIIWRTDSMTKYDMTLLLSCGARIDTRAGGVVFTHQNTLLSRSGAASTIPTTADIAVSDNTISINMPVFPDGSSYLQTGNPRITAYIPVAIPLRLLTSYTNHRWGHLVEETILRIVGRQYGYGSSEYPLSIASRLDSLDATLTWLLNTIEPFKAYRDRAWATVPGTYDYTVKNNVRRILVIVKGAGSCGGTGHALQRSVQVAPITGITTEVIIAPGHGGGEGGCLAQLIDVAPGQKYAYVVGAGGGRVAGVPPANELVPIGASQGLAPNGAGGFSAFYLSETVNPAAPHILCYGGSPCASVIDFNGDPWAYYSDGAGGEAGTGGAGSSSIPKSSIFPLGSLGYIHKNGLSGNVYFVPPGPNAATDCQIKSAGVGMATYPSKTAFGGAPAAASNFCGLPAGHGGGSSVIYMGFIKDTSHFPPTLNRWYRQQIISPSVGGNGAVVIISGAKVEALTEATFNEATVASMLGDALNSY